MRKHARSYGAHGYKVNLWLDRGRVWVEWRDAKNKRKTKSWPAAMEADAKRWAQEYADERRRLSPVAGPIPTVTELWIKYKAANGHTWRPKTAKLYAEWAARLAVITKPVSQLTHDDADTLRDQMRPKIAHGTIRRTLGFLRQLLNFAQGRKLVGVNPLATYRYATPKHERSEPPAEYTRDEIVQILGALDRHPSHWRPRNVIRLCATFGARINAILRLRWDDVNLDAGTVTFRAEWDKTGETFTRPMPDLARKALLEAHNHRNTTAWVFWSPRGDKPIHYNSVWYHLIEAEKRAGVRHLQKRAFHGERRLVIGNIGDLLIAGRWVNQKTLAVTQGYMRERPEHLEQARRKVGNSDGE